MSRFSWGAAVCAAIAVVSTARVAFAYEPACHSSTDFVYRVRPKDTLSQIAADLYCIRATPTIEHVWKYIYDYNSLVAGPNPKAVPVDTMLCLPARVEGPGWNADRCIAPSATPNVKDAPPDIKSGPPDSNIKPAQVPSSGAEIASRDETPKTDGASIVVKTGGAGSSGSHDRPSNEWSVLQGVSPYLAAGVMVPISGAAQDRLHRVLGMIGIGVRITLGRVEVSPRALLVVGQHEVTFNSTGNQPQSVVGGGFLAQVGVPLPVGPIRVTPGLEVGWIHLEREITQTEYPFKGEVFESPVDLPVAGAFVRPEYRISTSPRRAAVLAVEVGGAVMPARLLDTGTTANFNIKVLGGVGYDF